jgi:hypothetical protein
LIIVVYIYLHARTLKLTTAASNRCMTLSTVYVINKFGQHLKSTAGKPNSSSYMGDTC